MKKDIGKQQIPVAIQNYLIAAMSENTKERLLPLMEPVILDRDEILYEPGVRLNHVYFPIDAIVALTFVTTDGTTVGLSVIGNEGMVGIIALLSGVSTCTKADVMSSGFAFRLPRQAMQDEFDLHDSTLLLFLRYLQTLITQMSLTAVCNRHHTIDQQFCKLLLLSLDRLPCNNLSLTQELASLMLGVRREGITEAAIKLQKLGVIDYHRGHITVLNRNRLEQLGCECYQVLKTETSKLLPPQAISLPISAAFTARPNSYIEPKCVHCFKFGSCTYLKSNIKQSTQKCVSTSLSI